MRSTWSRSSSCWPTPRAAPTAANDTATTDAGKPVTIAVLANDKGTGLTIPSVTTPANGTARINTDRTITYTPDAGFSGSDSFRYTIRDGDDRTASATVTVTVRDVPDPTPVYLGCYLNRGTAGSDGTWPGSAFRSVLVPFQWVGWVRFVAEDCTPPVGNSPSR